jgi:4,5-dihydroxyphthalate decarboxylase
MSGKLRLTVATGDYDITRPLVDGDVEASGLDIVGVTMPSPQRHWRMLKHREFDVAELSLGSYCARVSRGEDDLVAIPAFPHRRFRHGYVYGSAAAGITSPEQLKGRRVGVRSWQTTAGVWLRGILDEYHGLPVSSVDWIAQDEEDVPMSLPPEITLRRVSTGAAVTDECASGDVEGLIYPEIPRQVLAGDGTIRRLFDDPKVAEQEYYRQTGIFPIMHVVAIRAELVEKYPWLPRSVFDAFGESKRQAQQRLNDPRTVSLAWLRALQEEERALLGPDPWRYGLDDVNRHTLGTFLGYASAQGVTARPVAVDELFSASTREAIPHYV